MKQRHGKYVGYYQGPHVCNTPRLLLVRRRKRRVWQCGECERRYVQGRAHGQKFWWNYDVYERLENASRRQQQLDEDRQGRR